MRRLVSQDPRPPALAAVLPRSTMFPPTLGSKTVSAIGTGSRLCSGGLKSPNRSVNTVNALSIGALTTISRRTTAASAWVMSSPRSVLDGGLVAIQRPTPERVQLVLSAATPAGLSRYTRRVPSALSATRPASFKTRRCCDTACRLIGSSSAISPTARGRLGQALHDGEPAGITQRFPALDAL